MVRVFHHMAADVLRCLFQESSGILYTLSQSHSQQAFILKTDKVQQMLPYSLCHDRCEAGHTAGPSVFLSARQI